MIQEPNESTRRSLQRPFGSLQSMRLAIDHRDGLDRSGLFAAFLLSAILIVARNPTFFTHPQFWAEDGVVWYAQAYNSGWLHSIFVPQAGYLCTVQRLVVGISLLMHLEYAALPMMLWGLLAQALPVPILLSSRCRPWGPLSTRLIFAFVYVAIPNAQDVHVVCTNSQWHLATAALLLAFAAAPRTAWQRIFDLTVLVLCVLSGPFAIVILPFAAAFWWIRRQRWSLLVVAVLTTGSLIQLCVMQFHKAQRIIPYQGAPPHLGATPALFIRMLGIDVFAGALLGSNRYQARAPFIVAFAVFTVGLVVCSYCFRFASVEARLSSVCCFAFFVAGLLKPLTLPVDGSLWQGIAGQPELRYWFFPSLPFLFAIVWCVGLARSRTIRLISIAMALLLCVGIVHDWKIRSVANPQFYAAVKAFDEAPHGAHVMIPINPIGWTMRLVKK